MLKLEDLSQGDQVAYVPMHAGGDVHHRDVEFGFVFAAGRDPSAVFVRYWRQGRPGSLRTVANSESTPLECLVRYVSVPQAAVEAALRSIATADA
jgi:hypothetical protein